MNKIEDIGQLQSEIKRLRDLAKQREQQIKNDLKEIREDLKPQNILWNSLSSITGIKTDKKEFFKDGVASGLSVLFQRFVLKTEKKVEGKIYDVVDAVFDRIKTFVSKFASQDAKREERKDA
jgi:hypothetical protein